MDVSDIKLMLQLPRLYDNKVLDEMIGNMLELENIPCNKPPMLKMEKGSLKLPSTSNTDWTRKATGASFLEPIQDEESTKLFKSNKESLSNIYMPECKKIKLHTEYSDRTARCTPQKKIETTIKSYEKNLDIVSNSIGICNKNEEKKEKSPLLNVSLGPKPQCEENVDLEIKELGGISQQHISGTLLGEDSGDNGFFCKIDKNEAERITMDAANVDRVISSLVEAQQKLCTETPKPDTSEWTELRYSQAVFRAQSDKLSTMQPSKEEDKSHSIGNFIKAFERIIKVCVRFAKHIPGFRDLHLDDQISLLRECRQTSHFPNTFSSVNEEQRIISPFVDMHLSFELFDELLSVPILNYAIEQSRTRMTWRTLKEEDALIKAILITNPDHCKELKDRKMAEHIHTTMIAYLLHVIKKTSKDAKGVIKRKKEIESLLCACRQFSVLFRSSFKEQLTRIAGKNDNWEVLDTL